MSSIVYGSAMPKGLIEPHGTVEVPILIQVTELEEQEVTAYFSIFGNTAYKLVCLLNILRYIVTAFDFSYAQVCFGKKTATTFRISFMLNS